MVYEQTSFSLHYMLNSIFTHQNMYKSWGKKILKKKFGKKWKNEWKKMLISLSSFRILVWGLYLKCMELGLFILNQLFTFRILVWGLYLKCMELGLFILNQLFTFCACPTWGVQRLRIREPHGNFFQRNLWTSKSNYKIKTHTHKQKGDDIFGIDN